MKLKLVILKLKLEIKLKLSLAILTKLRNISQNIPYSWLALSPTLQGRLVGPTVPYPGQVR